MSQAFFSISFSLMTKPSSQPCGVAAVSSWLTSIMSPGFQLSPDSFMTPYSVTPEPDIALPWSGPAHNLVLVEHHLHRIVQVQLLAPVRHLSALLGHLSLGRVTQSVATAPSYLSFGSPENAAMSDDRHAIMSISRDGSAICSS
jgi:hypothetical protein